MGARADLPGVRALPSIDDFTIHRATGLLGAPGSKAPYDYVEIIDVADMDGFWSDISGAASQAVAAEFRGWLAGEPLFITTDELTFVTRFAGRVVVVTGAGRRRGLGAAILRRFADEGAHCVVSDRTIDPEAEAVAEGVGGIAVACDVADPAQCERLSAAALDRFGRLDVWVNNAGIGNRMVPLLDVAPADWAEVIAVNLSGAFHGTQAAARAIIAGARGGRIINIASQAAKTGFPHMASYCASKHGMIGLTRVSAIELGQHAITVNAVCPNHVTTDLGEEQNAYFARLLGFADVAAYLANMRARNPIGRPGLPQDTAAACAWLASDDAAYVTGEAINVSGGEEMH